MTWAPMTSEKLEDYLSIWDKLIDNGYRKMLDITLQLDFTWRDPTPHYTLTYGEERRELTREQAWRVKDWLDSLAQGGPPK